LILIIDNYDSFTFNLVQCFGALGLEDEGLRRDIRVVRNDEMSIDALEALRPTHLVISPGPCTPNESGVSRDAIRRFRSRIPILGVCLGHQCIAEVCGARVRRADQVMHGKTSLTRHDNRTIFAGLPNPFEAMRYHSLIVDRATLDSSLEVSAWTDDGVCMGLRCRDEAIEGVQFHPESFMTPAGSALLANFLRI